MNGNFDENDGAFTATPGPFAGARVTERRIASCAVWGAAETDESARELYLRFALAAPVADGVIFTHQSGVYVRVAGDGGGLRAPLLFRELKHFWPDVKNYDYLPGEDMAIHKSVAQFVDKTHRVRATRQNCYTRRTGLFLPVFARRPHTEDAAPDPLRGEPLFQTDWRDHRRFIEYTEEKDMDAYLVHVLSALLQP